MTSGQGQGLLAVATGAAIAVAAQWAIGYFGKSEARSRQLKDECAVLLALSEDLQKRVMQQLRGTAPAENAYPWDGAAYRRARIRLQSLDPPLSIRAALTDLDETRADLRLASRLAAAHPTAEYEDLAYAVQAHADAIGHFATAGSILARVSWPAALNDLLQVSVPGIHLVGALAGSLP